MKFLQISTLWLALFLLVGAGCGEQKQKSKENPKKYLPNIIIQTISSRQIVCGNWN